MKKITLTFILLLFLNLSFSQTYSTGTVTLDSDYTVEFSVNTTTSEVTMTLIGPDNVWLGVGPGIALGLGMGNAGDDAIIYSSLGLQDRNMPAGTGTPNLDASQDWTLTSNTTNAGVRTVVATRDVNTGDANDYVFPTTSGSGFPILWAKGNGTLALGYHGGANRSGTMATLSIPTFNTNFSFTLYPNPATTHFEIDVPSQFTSAKVEVYNVLGKQILKQDISKIDNRIYVNSWQSGIYLIKVTSENQSQTKRFIKN